MVAFPIVEGTVWIISWPGLDCQRRSPEQILEPLGGIDLEVVWVAVGVIEVSEIGC